MSPCNRCLPGTVCQSCRNAEAEYCFGLISGTGFARFRARYEQRKMAPYRNPHGQMTAYAEQLPAGEIKAGDSVVACRLGDGALFVKKVTRVTPPTTATVELEGA